VSAPVPYRTTIRHSRTERVHHAFRYRHLMWLVDLDHVPEPHRHLGSWLPQFLTRDHFGDPRGTLRTNVEQYLAGNGIELDGGRILMLTNPRSLGYAFNPITVFWCYASDGSLRTIIAEVHNTFGERHCYLVDPEANAANVDKDFYVSPFFPVDGTYDMRFGQPEDEVHIAITLRRGPTNAPVFTATLHGRRGRTPRSFELAALRHPAASVRVIALIHWQAIQLWFRRLPIVSRPLATRQEHVS
jgi:uncharacterized protein